MARRVENKATYDADRRDVGFYLRVTATYRDAWSGDDNAVNTKPVVETTANAVLGGTPLTGSPPAFMVNGADVESVSVEVAENSPAGTYVGDPLPKAIDPDNKDAKPVYSLSWLDKGSRRLEVLHTARKWTDTDDVTTLQLSGGRAEYHGWYNTELRINEMYNAVDLDKEDSKKNTFMFLLKACESSESPV